MDGSCEDSASYTDPVYGDSCDEWVGWSCDFSSELEANCPVACGICSGDDDECTDSTSWYYKKAKRDCSYVGKKSSRCKSKVKDEADVTSAEACPVACGTCPGSCADSTSWYSKKSKNDCSWAAKKSKRCKSKYKDTNGIKSKVACPVACDEC